MPAQDTSPNIDWNQLMQQLGAAGMLTGGYQQSVNPSWNNFMPQNPSLFKGFDSAYISPDTNTPGTNFLNPSPSQILYNGLLGNNVITNHTTASNTSGQSPSKIGSYYGVPVFDPKSGQITYKSNLLSDKGNIDVFNPYIQNGQYFSADPTKQNPVPVSTVPGANLKPDKTATQAANNTQALVNLLPSVQNAIAGQAIPQQQAQLAAAQATSGPYADLMTRLYAAYGPVLNNIGNKINLQNAQAGAATQASVLGNEGKGLTSAGLDLMKQVNPEYFDARANTGASIDKLLGQTTQQLGGDLSGSEYRAIQQGLAQEGQQRGTVNAPNMTETIANAQKYGAAGYNRNIQSQNQLSQAIGAATAFMPQSQISGFNPIAQVTGSNLSNPGAGQFTGVNNAGQNAFGSIAGLTSGLQNQTNNIDNNNSSLLQQNNQINQQNKLQNSWQNILGTIGGAVGSLI